MDYHSLPRRQLQSLCKKHGILANATNVEMADALSALLNKPKPEAKTRMPTRSKASETLPTSSVNSGRRAATSARKTAAGHTNPVDEPETETTVVEESVAGILSSDSDVSVGRASKSRAGGIQLRRGKNRVKSPGKTSQSPKPKEQVEEEGGRNAELGGGTTSHSNACPQDSTNTRSKKVGVTFSNTIEVRSIEEESPTEEIISVARKKSSKPSASMVEKLTRSRRKVDTAEDVVETQEFVSSSRSLRRQSLAPSIVVEKQVVTTRGGLKKADTAAEEVMVETQESVSSTRNLRQQSLAPEAVEKLVVTTRSGLKKDSTRVEDDGKNLRKTRGSSAMDVGCTPKSAVKDDATRAGNAKNSAEEVGILVGDDDDDVGVLAERKQRKTGKSREKQVVWKGAEKVEPQKMAHSEVDEGDSYASSCVDTDDVLPMVNSRSSRRRTLAAQKQPRRRTKESASSAAEEMDHVIRDVPEFEQESSQRAKQQLPVVPAQKQLKITRSRVKNMSGSDGPSAVPLEEEGGLLEKLKAKQAVAGNTADQDTPAMPELEQELCEKVQQLPVAVPQEEEEEDLPEKLKAQAVAWNTTNEDTPAMPELEQESCEKVQQLPVAIPQEEEEGFPDNLSDFLHQPEPESKHAATRGDEVVFIDAYILGNDCEAVRADVNEEAFFSVADGQIREMAGMEGTTSTNEEACSKDQSLEGSELETESTIATLLKEKPMPFQHEGTLLELSSDLSDFSHQPEPESEHAATREGDEVASIDAYILGNDWGFGRADVNEEAFFSVADGRIREVAGMEGTTSTNEEACSKDQSSAGNELETESTIATLLKEKAMPLQHEGTLLELSSDLPDFSHQPEPKSEHAATREGDEAVSMNAHILGNDSGFGRADVNEEAFFSAADGQIREVAGMEGTTSTNEEACSKDQSSEGNKRETESTVATLLNEKTMPLQHEGTLLELSSDLSDFSHQREPESEHAATGEVDEVVPIDAYILGCGVGRADVNEEAFFSVADGEIREVPGMEGTTSANEEACSKDQSSEGNKLETESTVATLLNEKTMPLQHEGTLLELSSDLSDFSHHPEPESEHAAIIEGHEVVSIDAYVLGNDCGVVNEEAFFSVADGQITEMAGMEGTTSSNEEACSKDQSSECNELKTESTAATLLKEKSMPLQHEGTLLELSSDLSDFSHQPEPESEHTYILGNDSGFGRADVVEEAFFSVADGQIREVAGMEGTTSTNEEACSKDQSWEGNELEPESTVATLVKEKTMPLQHEGTLLELSSDLSDFSHQREPETEHGEGDEAGSIDAYILGNDCGVGTADVNEEAFLDGQIREVAGMEGTTSTNAEACSKDQSLEGNDLETESNFATLLKEKTMPLEHEGTLLGLSSDLSDFSHQPEPESEHAAIREGDGVVSIDAYIFGNDCGVGRADVNGEAFFSVADGQIREMAGMEGTTSTNEEACSKDQSSEGNELQTESTVATLLKEKTMPLQHEGTLLELSSDLSDFSHQQEPESEHAATRDGDEGVSIDAYILGNDWGVGRADVNEEAFFSVADGQIREMAGMEGGTTSTNEEACSKDQSSEGNEPETESTVATLLKEKTMPLQHEETLLELSFDLSGFSHQSEPESEHAATREGDEVVATDAYILDNDWGVGRADVNEEAFFSMGDGRIREVAGMGGTTSTNEESCSKDQSLEGNELLTESTVATLLKEKTMQHLDLTLMSLRKLRALCKENKLSAKQSDKTKTKMPDTKEQLPSAGKRSALKALSSNVAQTPRPKALPSNVVHTPRPGNLLSSYEGIECGASPQVTRSSSGDMRRSHFL